jgi:UDP-N-acetylglucosamine diphosphorylase / glucose-1-phosphate thymidylyltransferase / UDP-N-acetylgalactosamine diphosphorylase / glucosamine-1-phosphate N-acetyltransferase / galactosamine-1-phosphate N-acetyltransferase
LRLRSPRRSFSSGRVQAAELLTLSPSLAAFAPFFRPEQAPWEWLRRIPAALASLPPPAPLTGLPPGVHVEGPVWLGEGVRLPPYATLLGPLWIGPGTEIRPGAYLRGNVIVGAGAVLGNACEFKHCLLLDGVQAPHFNYVGDSILGERAHLGAGVICSNLRLDQQEVTVRMPDGLVATGLRKFGAVLGDGAEVGCNAVLNPGTILGKRALVMPTTAFAGFLPAGTIARARAVLQTFPRRD